MKSNEITKFSALLTDVLAYYGKDCSEFTTNVWWEAMKSFDFEQVAKAIQKHATDPERGQFAPKVADIVKVLQGTTSERAALAWGKAFEAMSRIGAYTDVVFDDAAIHAAIADCGGWPKVCRTETAELSYLQHRFQQAYKAYTERGTFDYPKRLGGDRSPDDEYRKIGMKPPPPVAVGDVARARLVFKGGGGSSVQINSLGFEDVLPKLSAPSQPINEQ